MNILARKDEARHNQRRGGRLAHVAATGAIDDGKITGPASEAIAYNRIAEYTRILNEIERDIGNACPKYVQFVRLIRQYAATNLSSNEPKVIGIVSANEGEGRTTVALGLAAALSEIHGRVAFVEAESNGSLQRQLAQPESIGLSGFLSNEASADHVLVPTTRPGLWMLPAGQMRSHLTDLEAINGMRQLFDHMRGEFDAVVVDLPPMLFNEGVPAYASDLDEIVLVVAAGKTTMRDIETTLKLCGDVKLNGIFINQAVLYTPRWLLSMLAFA